MIHNAEIHITRADPARHNGEEGYVVAITFGSRYITFKHWMFPTRGEAALFGGDMITAYEQAISEAEAVREKG